MGRAKMIQNIMMFCLVVSVLCGTVGCLAFNQSSSKGDVDTPNVPSSMPTSELTLTPKATETMISSLTLTPEPTATATETPIPAEVEKYSIDVEKLHNFPESYEYLVNNLDEFVETPDLLEDLEAFKEWVGKLEGVIGDYTNREVNYRASSLGFQPNFYIASNFSTPKSIEGNPEVAYFKHKGEIFLMINMNIFYIEGVYGNGGFVRTMLVILHKGVGVPEEERLLENLNDGGHIRQVGLLTTSNENRWPPVVNEAIDKGLVPSMDENNYNQIIFGLGFVQTEEGFQKKINGN